MPKIPVFASGSLALGGLVLMVMGIYFGFLRPSLLPEDARYMGASLAQIQIAVPGLLPRLSRVFGVLAGYMFATGLLTVYVAGTGFRAGRPGATAIVAVSGLASIGWMATTNFLIDSDFKWLLLAFTLPWVVALVLTWAGGRKPLDPADVARATPKEAAKSIAGILNGSPPARRGSGHPMTTGALKVGGLFSVLGVQETERQLQRLSRCRPRLGQSGHRLDNCFV